MPDGIELRCSAIVVRQHVVLLIHRTYDWVQRQRANRQVGRPEQGIYRGRLPG